MFRTQQAERVEHFRRSNRHFIGLKQHITDDDDDKDGGVKQLILMRIDLSPE